MYNITYGVNPTYQSLPGFAIMRLVYGSRDPSRTQGYVKLADRALESAARAVVPGSFLAESIPLLRYIPGWLPGGKARRFAEQYRPIVQQMRNKPFDELQEAMVITDLYSSQFVPLF